MNLIHSQFIEWVYGSLVIRYEIPGMDKYTIFLFHCFFFVFYHLGNRKSKMSKPIFQLSFRTETVFART